MVLASAGNVNGLRRGRVVLVWLAKANRWVLEIGEYSTSISLFKKFITAFACARKQCTKESRRSCNEMSTGRKVCRCGAGRLSML